MKKHMLILVVSLITTSCFDFFHDPDEYFYLKDRFKSIADFKEGSFWIYHSDSLNINDTITVISYKKEQTKEPFDSHFQYREYVVIKLKSTYWNCSIRDILEARSDYLNNYERSYSEKQVVGTIGFTIDFLGANDVGSQYGNAQYLSNYNFNGENLNQVLYHLTQGGRHVEGCEYYFAPGYGLIQMKLMNDSIATEWRLIDFDIVK